MNILELNSESAREFFLQAESYCSVDLPLYFQFQPVLKKVHQILQDHRLSDYSSKVRDHEDVNYTFYSNKDGKYAWRPLQLIHPALYVSLVHAITETEAWSHLQSRFEVFQSDTRIRCISIPQVPEEGKTGKAVQIENWWHEIEQASIELSLDFAYLIETDIAECYASIYTHTIPWATHDKDVAKKAKRENRLNSLYSHVIDNLLQDMHHGQTNGIPQGSALMDFIAEIVLGYADLELSRRLGVTDFSAVSDQESFQILRYRDDYRIFVNNPQLGGKILKILTEILIDLNLKLNSSKTRSSADVIRDSMKDDKRDWLFHSVSQSSLQNQLLAIHEHASHHPNTGSVVKALNAVQRNIANELPPVHQTQVLVAIVADIALHNPRCTAVCAAIISQLLQNINSAHSKKTILKKIFDKFNRIPNTGHLQIWLQRISLPIDANEPYNVPLCRLVTGAPLNLWNNLWITNLQLKMACDPQEILDKECMESLSIVIDASEFRIFMY